MYMEYILGWLQWEVFLCDLTWIILSVIFVSGFNLTVSCFIERNTTWIYWFTDLLVLLMILSVCLSHIVLEWTHKTVCCCSFILYFKVKVKSPIVNRSSHSSVTNVNRAVLIFVSNAPSQQWVPHGITQYYLPPDTGKLVHALNMGGGPDLHILLLQPSQRWSQYYSVLLGEQRHVCEWLAQGRYLAVPRLGVEPATSGLQFWHVTVTLPIQWFVTWALIVQCIIRRVCVCC